MPRRYLRLIWGFACFASWTSVLAQGQPSLPQAPVPSAWLNGRTLTVPGLGFSVDALADGWRWFELKQDNTLGVRGFAARAANDEPLLMLSCFPASEGQHATVGMFLEGFSESRRAAGWRVEKPNVAKVTRPEGAYRWSLKVTLPDGTEGFLVGYFVSLDRAYVAMHSRVVSTVADGEFDEFARSFRRLPRPAAGPPGASRNPLTEGSTEPSGSQAATAPVAARAVGRVLGYLGSVVGLAYLIVWMWAKRREDRKVTAGKVILVALVLLFLLAGSQIGSRR